MILKSQCNLEILETNTLIKQSPQNARATLKLAEKEKLTVFFSYGP